MYQTIHPYWLRPWLRVAAAWLFFATALPGQDATQQPEMPLLFSNTAYTLPVRKGGFSLLHTSRYTVGKRLELGFHPILMFLSPDIEFKWKQMESERFTLSSFHSINYASPLLRTVRMEGAGGFVSPEFDIPHLFAFQNGVMISKVLRNRHYVTGKALFEFALRSKAPDERSTIDLPIVYPRSAVYYKGYGFITGVSLEGRLYKRFSYVFATDAYFFPRDGLLFFSEQQLGLIWRTGKKFLLMGGGELTYGEYPYGPQWHLFPVLDFRWFLHL